MWSAEGVEIFSGAEVTAFIVDNSGALTSVETSMRRIDYDFVVAGAGPVIVDKCADDL